MQQSLTRPAVADHRTPAQGLVIGNDGTLPIGDHRHGYAYLFAPACPACSAAVGLGCDRANGNEINRHLRDTSAATAPGTHAVLVLDGGTSLGAFESPLMSPCSTCRTCPELNLMEQVFAYLTSNRLCN